MSIELAKAALEGFNLDTGTGCEHRGGDGQENKAEAETALEEAALEQEKAEIHRTGEGIAIHAA